MEPKEGVSARELFVNRACNLFNEHGGLPYVETLYKRFENSRPDGNGASLDGVVDYNQYCESIGRKPDEFQSVESFVDAALSFHERSRMKPGTGSQ